MVGEGKRDLCVRERMAVGDMCVLVNGSTRKEESYMRVYKTCINTDELWQVDCDYSVSHSLF